MSAHAVLPKVGTVQVEGHTCESGRYDRDSLKTTYCIEWRKSLFNWFGIDLGCTDYTVVYTVPCKEEDTLEEVLNKEEPALYVCLPSIYTKNKVLEIIEDICAKGII